MRVPRIRRLVPAIVLLSACGPADPIIVPRPGAPEVRRGPLAVRPVSFSNDDYYLWEGQTHVAAEEGWLRVPESRVRGTGRTVEIHYVRLPATAAAAPGYPVVYLAGGPGGSGTLSAAGDRFPLFTKLRVAGDVIALDQRGTSFTRPRPECPGEWSYPLDRPLDEATLAAVVAPWLRECAGAWRDSLDVAAFNARESADDLEALRLALGAEKLSLLGISYGTHLGLAYLRRYPDRVHRAVLAGVEGPDHGYKSPAAIERVLMRVDSAIKADPRARAAIPEFARSLRAAVERLRRAPATVEVARQSTGERFRVTVGPHDLQRAVFYNLSEHETIERRLLERTLPILLRNDYRNLGEWAVRSRRGNSGLVMSLSTDCASGATAARRERIRRETDSATLGDAANMLQRAQCAAWPAEDLGDEFRGPLRSDVPVLFVSGTLDPRTPPSNVEELLPGFPNGRHLVIDGGGHDDDLLITPRGLPDVIARFLRGEEPGVTRIAMRPLRFVLPKGWK